MKTPSRPPFPPRPATGTRLSRRAYLRRLCAGAAAAAALPPLAAALRLPDAAAADEPPVPGSGPSPYQIPAFETAKVEFRALGDGLHLLFGPGGNIAVATAPEGTLLVDSGVRSRGGAIVQGVAGLPGARPITTLVNTHWHFDHTGANERLGATGVRIVAHENTRARLAAPQQLEALGVTFPAAPAAALPTLTFDGRATLFFGSHRLELTHVAPAHTDGDVAVFFREANVLHTGDLLFNGFYPVIDYSSGGWIGGMIAAHERLLTLDGVNERTQVIPGHGPLATTAEIKASRDMLRTVQERVAPMVRSGQKLDQIIAAKPTADLDPTWGHGLMDAAAFLKMVVGGLERHG